MIGESLSEPHTGSKQWYVRASYTDGKQQNAGAWYVQASRVQAVNDKMQTPWYVLASSVWTVNDKMQSTMLHMSIAYMDGRAVKLNRLTD